MVLKLKSTLLYIKRIIWSFILIGKPKIFVISFQRAGTTSTGVFFKEHGFNVATYGTSKKNSWTLNWFKGDYQKIFKSLDFKSNQVFEDDPWWCGDFYKYLFHKFPTSKFILLERDPDKWFDSMVSHSKGKNLGNSYRHAKLYQRLEEFNQGDYTKTNQYKPIIDNLMPLNEDFRQHYIKIYKERNQEIKDFFDHFGRDRIYCGQLEDKNKWSAIGDFIGFKVATNYEAHANKTNK